jgi:DNA-binding MarR family transcriptional regulator
MNDNSKYRSRGDIGSVIKTLHIIKRKLLKEFGKELRQHNLDPSSGMTLHGIISQGRLTMSELHDLTGFERGSLTTIVDGLIDRGFVKRERGEMDRRKVFVIPTPKGISVDGEMQRAIDHHVKRMLERLSSEDRTRFFKAMKTLEEIGKKL